MKKLLGLLVFLALPTSAVSQNPSHSLTIEQNWDWLLKVKNADKELQLRLIKERLFENRQAMSQDDKLALPLLIIDGVPIDINDRQREFLNVQLTVDNVNITVLEKEPEGLYINKGFTGIVAIVITDKKTSRRFGKLK